MSHEAVLEELETALEGTGLECRPFKIGWYNALVAAAFRFPYPEDALAVVVLSSPSMFEKVFLPFLATRYQPGLTTDPIDQCAREQLDRLAALFPQYAVQRIQDNEMHPASHRPKVLVQTAGHVAGATYLYQKSDVSPDAWAEEKKIFPVSMHPKYGGWFAFRGVLLFKDLLAPGLVQQAPVDCVPSRERRIELLEKYNFHWQDWGPGSFRHVSECEIEETYSQKQQTYFTTEPAQRFDLIAAWQKEES